MRKTHLSPAVLLLAITLSGPLGFAQDSSALLVVPSNVTMLVGETHTFRAVGKDGRMLHNIRWGISPEYAATLTTDGNEATLLAEQISSAVILTAYGSGGSSMARIEIRSGTSLPVGATKWSVKELPGCKTTKIIPAVPSAGGPDIYVQESCPDGAFVRAITDDGRELWRRNISGSALPLPSDSQKDGGAEQVGHLNLNSHSLCDDISSGMTKDMVSKFAEDRGLRLQQKERDSVSWVFDEHTFRCQILFGSVGTVVKKKKTIITD